MADKDFVVKNGLVVNSTLVVANTTSGRVGVGTSAPDALFTVAGTANLQGNVVFTGNQLNVTSNALFGGNVHVTNNVFIDKKLFVGNTATMVQNLPTIIQAVDNFNGFVMISSQNLSLEDDACADLLIYADNTNGLSNFNDLGINNSRFDGRIHRIIVNAAAGAWQLGETVFQKNGAGANIAVGQIRDITTINATAVSLKIRVSEDDGISTYVGMADFANTTGSNLALRAVTSAANADILHAVPFGSTSANTLSRRNYAFTVGRNGDGYLYNANSALTIGTTGGGIRSTNVSVATSFSSGVNAIVLSSGNTSTLKPDMNLSGTGIDTGTYITSITNSTSFKISKNTTAPLVSGTITAQDEFYDINDAKNPIIFHTGGMMAKDEIARFTGNGNFVIGVNTTSRSAKLNVNGTANIAGQTNVGANLNVTGVMTATGNVVGSAGIFSSVNASSANITSTNVQTINVSSKMTVANIELGTIVANGTTVAIGNSTTNLTISSSILAIGNSTVNTTVNSISLTTGSLTASSNTNIGSGKFFVDTAAGRVGINNTSPDAALTVTGSANVSGDFRVTGNLYVTGSTISTSNMIAAADFRPDANNLYSLGGAGLRWDYLYANNVDLTTGLFAGNTTTNLVANSTLVRVANASGTANLSPTALTIGSSIVNSTVQGFGGSVFMNSSAVAAGITVMNTTTLAVGANVVANASAISIGNSSVNATINSTAFSGLAANASALGGKTEGNLNVNNAVYFNGQPSTYYANVTSPQISTSISVGNSSVTTASQITVANTSGTTTINSNFISTTSLRGNVTGNVVATTISGNLTGNVVATTITGNLTGNVVATTISGNLTGNVAATEITGNLTGNVAAVTVSASANVTLGANLLINTSAIAITNSSAALVHNARSVTLGNSSITSAPQITVANTSGTTTINANFVSTTSLSGNLTGNVAATTISGNLTGNVVATTITGNLTGNVAATTITGNLTGNVIATTISGNLTGNVTATTISASANVSTNTLSVTNVISTFVNASSANIATINSSSISATTLTVAASNTVINSSVVYVAQKLGINVAAPVVSLQIAANDAIRLPSGNTAQRPTGVVGYLRYNNETSNFEGFSNGAWGAVGGGGGYYKGSGSTVNPAGIANIFRINTTTLNNDTTISDGENAQATGPIVIASGKTLTVDPGGRVAIV